MKKAKWIIAVSIIIVIPLLIVFSSSSEAGTSKDPNAIYKIAWQYIVQQMDSSKSGLQLNGAKITRLELVDTYSKTNEEKVDIYSLEYSIFIDQEKGWIPGSTGYGSPYLFTVNNNGSPRVIGVEFSKDILANGGYRETADKLLTNEKTLDFEKHSSAAGGPYTQEEIDTAINIAKDSFIRENDDFIINVWYDKKKCQKKVDEYKTTETLYGMSEAAKRGDLLFLQCDNYSLNPSFDQLNRDMNIILMRDSKSAPWKIIDTGY